MSGVTVEPSTIRDVCQLLGGLALDGANLALLARIHRDAAAADLAARVGGPLGEALAALGAGDTDPEALAAEFTRLTIIGPRARGKAPVPPFEDCWTGDKRLLGERSRAAMQAYVSASLGFDGIKGEPADHIGLELCFVAALADEEVRGERDGSARFRFVKDHLAGFAPTFGEALVREAKLPFWAAVGRALVELPRWLQPTSLRVTA